MVGQKIAPPIRAGGWSTTLQRRTPAAFVQSAVTEGFRMWRSITILGAGLSIGALLVGCELSPSNPGKIQPNTAPNVFFLNTFSSIIDTTITPEKDFFGRTFLDTLLTLNATEVNYSSIISWYGTDIDGFVESYEYAIESVANDTLFTPADLAAITPANIPDSAWVTTSSTTDTILFLAPHLRDRHRLWIRAVDDRGARSEPKFSDFIAVTEPPAVVLQCSDEDIDDGACPPDSVFSLFGPTPVWQGIHLEWEGSDPDGTIASYIVKIGENTPIVTTETSIDLTAADGLTDGSHTIYVYAVDNAGAISPIPAHRTLQVTVPSFERKLLVVIDGDQDWSLAPHVNMPMTNDQFKSFYRQVLTSGSFVEAGEEGVTWDFVTPQEINRALLGHYSHLLWINETPLVLFGSINPDGSNLTKTQHILASYFQAGGSGAFIGSLAASTANKPEELNDFFDSWFGVQVANIGRTDQIYGPDNSLALPFVVNGEAFDDANGNGTWDDGEDFDDVGLDGIAGTDDAGEANGKWEGGWSEVLIYNNPPDPPEREAYDPDLGGAHCASIASLTDPRAKVLYRDGEGTIISSVFHSATSSTALLLAPLQMAGPAYAPDQAQSGYGSSPEDAMALDQQELLSGVLRNVFQEIGLPE